MRVIVLDDSVIVREGLRRLLEAEGHQVVATLAHPNQVNAAVSAAHPDVVVLDIRMPPTFTDEGIQVAASLRQSMPGSMKAVSVATTAGIRPRWAASGCPDGGLADAGFKRTARAGHPYRSDNATSRRTM